MVNVVYKLFLLISFSWSIRGIPISNRSSGSSAKVQLSRGYLPLESSKITQRLGYHYSPGVLVITEPPPRVIPIVPNHRYGLPVKSYPGVGNSQPDAEIYRPAGIITEADGIVELETPTRPVQEEVVEGESFLPGGNRGTAHSTGHTLATTTTTTLKTQQKHQNTGAQAVASAITTLDWLLGNKGYNSPLHPPPSPVLALVLSKYGRYLPVTRGPRVYSYMAANNIHNSQPFGQYKWACEHGDDIGD